MPTKEWMEKYEAVKEKLTCKIDLDAYFTEKKIGKPLIYWKLGMYLFLQARYSPVIH